MALSSEELNRLVRLATSVTDDEMDCDECFTHLAEFAETQLANRPLNEVMQAVQNHLHNCPCCRDEYETLLEALKATQALEG